MNTIDTFLEESLKDNLKFAGISELISLLIDLSISFISAQRLISKAKKDIPTSRRLRTINDDARWQVYILDDNRKCFVVSVSELLPNQIYVTKKMIKVLNEPELMAILLHEALTISPNTRLLDFSLKHGLGFLISAVGDKIQNKWIKITFIVAVKMLLSYSQSKLKEYESDVEIKKYGYGEHLQSALKKIQRSEIMRFKSKKADMWAKKLEKDKSLQRRLERLKDKEKELSNVKTEKEFLKVALSAIKD